MRVNEDFVKQVKRKNALRSAIEDALKTAHADLEDVMYEDIIAALGEVYASYVGMYTRHMRWVRSLPVVRTYEALEPWRINEPGIFGTWPVVYVHDVDRVYQWRPDAVKVNDWIEIGSADQVEDPLMWEEEE